MARFVVKTLRVCSGLVVPTVSEALVAISLERAALLMGMS